MKKLQEKWGEFFKAFFSPWFVLAGVITATSIIFSIIFKDNQLFSNLLTIIGGITGGIAGSIFQNEYNKNTGQEILEKKGQSAVRNLQSIQKQINSLKGWVVGFFKKSSGENRNQLEEIYRHILTMELCVDSGYEDWIDIVPQLSKEKEEQEKINEKYKEVSVSLISELLDQKMKLYKTESTAEKEELGKKVSQLEKQIRNLKNENNIMTFPELSNFVTAGGGGGGGSILRGLPSFKSCTVCGKIFSCNLAGGLTASPACDVCQDCSNKIYSSVKK